MALALKRAPPEPAADTTLAHLQPAMLARVTRLLAWQHTRSWKPTPTEVRRTLERQAWLYALGRTTVALDGRGTGGRTVTNARTPATSWHGTGYAVDLIDADVAWNTQHPHYAAWCGDCAVGAHLFGLRWGGDWDGNPRTPQTLVDVPHFQLLELPVTPSLADQQDYALGTTNAIALRYHVATV